MSGIDAMQSVQHVSANGKRFAVLSIEAWEALLEWLETTEDLHVVEKALAELRAFNGDRKKAGWLEWDEFRKELE